MKLARWMSRLGTESAFEILARARALEAKGRDIIHLEIGEPDFNTPAHIRRRAQKALDEGWTHYGPAAGLPEVRAAVAEHLSRSRGLRFAPEEIILTPGAKPILLLTLFSLVNPGDEVIFPDPGFPIYESLIRFIGAKAVPMPLREANGFAPDLKELNRLLSPRTRLVILNSPGNPTGAVLTWEQIEGIGRLLRRRPQAWILSDEIYSRIIYDGEHRSIVPVPGLRDRTVLLDGFSKAYAMTGWRVGYAAAPRELISAMERLAINVHSCTASFSQIAAVAALRGPQEEVTRMVAEFKRRRDAIVAGLNSIPGFSCNAPDGAFYAFPNIRGTGLRAKDLAEKLLQEGGVACLPGTAFGHGGEGYLRFSYANSVSNIAAGIRRIRACLGGIPAAAGRTRSP